jgi:hypothetical protein
VRKDDVDRKIRDASTKPGPIYNVARQNSTPVNGGKMLESFDAVGSASWEFKKRKNMPGPGQYDRDLNEPLQTGGGRFSHENRWQQNQVFEQRSSQLPGPLEYDAGDSRDRANKRVVGGVISDAEVKSELDWILIRGSRTPGKIFPPLELEVEPRAYSCTDAETSTCKPHVFISQGRRRTSCRHWQQQRFAQRVAKVAVRPD